MAGMSKKICREEVGDPAASPTKGIDLKMGVNCSTINPLCFGLQSEAGEKGSIFGIFEKSLEFWRIKLENTGYRKFVKDLKVAT